jgi:hypothetical protein
MKAVFRGGLETRHRGFTGSFDDRHRGQAKIYDGRVAHYQRTDLMIHHRPNPITSLDAAMALLLHIESCWRGTSEAGCWAATRVS